MAALPEVDLPAGTRVIGDLHLDVEREGDEEVLAFLTWLDDHEEAPRLVILGDLFEFWIGPAQERAAAPVLRALAARTRAGVAVDVVPGNRDFLLGGRFERLTRARVHPEGFVGRTAAGRTLFLHGDTLCTGDVGYQRLRRVLRSGPVRWLGPRLPGAVGRAVARRLRRASSAAVSAKAPLEVAMRPEAARAAAEAAGAGTIVCGHAHAFRDELLEGGTRWLVVDAFGGARDALVVGEDGRVEPAALEP